MKTVIKTIAKIVKRQRGFTLIEMVTVVAIMGVMAAVAVPMVNTQLGKARDKSFLQDKAMIQTAVDSFFTASDNERFDGLRQFPIIGSTESTVVADRLETRGANLPFDDTDPPGQLVEIPGNPLAGSRGGEPKWREQEPPKDGSRDSVTEGLLNNVNATINNIVEFGGFYLAKVESRGGFFGVDSRDFFIDFNLLVKEGLLQNVPESASPDNGGGSTDGSYSWYVKATGAVESLFFHFPDNALDFGDDEPAIKDDDDARGFIEGVYP